VTVRRQHSEQLPPGEANTVRRADKLGAGVGRSQKRSIAQRPLPGTVTTMTTPTDTTSIDQGQASLTDLAAAVEAATDPMTRLSLLAALAKLTSSIQRASVTEARTGGHAWTAIGGQLGVTKQAAAKRFGTPREETAPVPPKTGHRAD
jgi:hypothetical protein